MSGQRPEWMPSRESLLPMCHNESLYDNCKHDYAGEEVEESHYHTGLRSQIAVLEEECDASDAEDLEFSDRDVQLYAIRRERWRESKIAALRKELGE